MDRNRLLLIIMGKKIKIVAEDPILTKNIKYEKRNKARLLEKAKSEEERALELKKKKEMLEVEHKVDRQIESITSNLANLQKHHSINKLKTQIFSKRTKSEERTSKSNEKVPELLFNNATKIQSFYEYHFGLQASEDRIVREKRATIKQKIEEQTRQEIKNMFGTANNQQDKEKQEEESLEGQAYNLLPEFKKESEAKINGEVYYVSQLFNEHKDVLTPNSVQLDNKPLDNAQMLIKSYFDHVFIENDQEQKIEEFRKIVIQHSIEHLESCFKAEKGRGFTNCKILILTPFFGDAKAIIEIIEGHFKDYEIVNNQKLEDVQDDNDFFRLGIKIARKKQHLTYFSHFDHSEFIIASPVGLKSIIGSQGDAKRQNSFISSVDILYIDRASVLLMQNWSHLTEIFKNINYMPKYESLKNSIDSIRDTFLELKGRLYRQNIVFSQYNFPQLNALKQAYFHNIQGIATSKVYYPKPVSQSKIEHNFYKIQLKHPREDLQTRFDYFKRKFWDDIHNKESMTKIVLFTNSYFEYVKIKAFLEKVNASAQYICEHTSQNKVQSRMAKFNNDQFRILLMTERAYYFQICQIKKFHHIYFYSLPKNSFIFEELVSSIEKNESQDQSVVSIYTKYDLFILQRIVGTGKAIEMVREYCNNVSFIL